MSNQVQMKIKKKKVLAAKLYYLFNNKAINLFLKYSIYISLFLITALLSLSYFEIADNFGLAIILGLVFILTFAVYNFSYGYLPYLASEQRLNQDELGEILSFDALQNAGRLNIEKAEFNDFITRILKTPRVKFAQEKIGLTNELIKKLTEQKQANTNEAMPRFNDIVNTSYGLALEQNNISITSVDIFYGILKTSPEYQKVCLALEIEDEDIKNVVFWSNRYFQIVEHRTTLIDKLRTSQAGLGQDWTAGYTLALNQFGEDLTRKGISGSYSIEGRSEVIRKIESSLTNEAKRSCLLLGPTGVGKTTLGFGLAAKLFWGQSEPTLNYHRVVKLNAQSIASSAKDTATVQNILTAVLNDAVRAGNVVLFIDEIQSLFSEDGTLGRINATEIIQPYLENANIRIVGTITESDYESYIRPKTAIAGNFEVIKVEPTNEQETLKILCDLAIYASKKHHKKITYGALKEIYKIGIRIAGGKEMPAKAIDMMLEILSSKETPTIITKNEALAFIQKNTNIPVADLGQESRQKLINLEEKIKTRLIGQEEAVSAVTNSLKRALTQERNNTKPIGSFLFLGPTGVGKTELAKSLAWAYFGNEETMVRMDMSQFKDLGSIRNFIGRKVSGKNELEGGEFVKKIRQKPYSVVLLDEIEKADKEILDLFLQVLDEGYLNDGAGEKVSLANNIIIATSNAGALEIKDAINKNIENYQVQIIDQIQKKGIFKPEFLNRFDGIILFKPLLESEITKVAEITIVKVIKSYQKKGYKLNIDNALINALAKEGYQPDLGARPLQRVIQNRIENYVAEKILNETYQKGGEYTITVNDIYGASK